MTSILQSIQDHLSVQNLTLLNLSESTQLSDWHSLSRESSLEGTTTKVAARETQHNKSLRPTTVTRPNAARPKVQFRHPSESSEATVVSPTLVSSGCCSSVVSPTLVSSGCCSKFIIFASLNKQPPHVRGLYYIFSTHSFTLLRIYRDTLLRTLMMAGWRRLLEMSLLY